ncbi:MAG: HPP family protein [Mariprofundus sp.]
MSTNLVSLDMDASVKDAVDLVQHSVLHDLPVIDHAGKPVGIVTSRSILHFAVPGYASSDLLAAMKAGPDIESVYKNLQAELKRPIMGVVDRNFASVKASTPTSAVAAMLINLKGDSQTVLVIDEAGKLIGIISARDIICRLSVMSGT